MERYALWRNKKNEGLKGKELAFFHPMTPDGYLERQAWQLGIHTPREQKLFAELEKDI